MCLSTRHAGNVKENMIEQTEGNKNKELINKNASAYSKHKEHKI
uniref:Uncharacterized protein n=1 Tax=Arundo donax TaxID=35708 RepID=A0A0A9ET05_ARUDO